MTGTVRGWLQRLGTLPGGSARFEEQGEVGRGGMGVVHRVRDRLLGRRIAVKLLRASPATARERFLSEAQITGQLAHPNIVAVHDYWADGERCAMAMKLVSGETLRERIHSAGADRLTPEILAEHLQILLKVLDAVGYAHSRGVVHRDLKPSNVMVGSFGQVYVMDWGMSTLLPDIAGGVELTHPRAQEGSGGTPSYMAPEQMDREAVVDERADVYALGGLLYAILTGRGPHKGRTPMLTMMAGYEGKVQAPIKVVPEVPPALSRIAMRALARAPAERTPSAAVMKEELEAFLRGAWALPARAYAAGDYVVREGEEGDEAYVLVRGHCVVQTAEGVWQRDLKPGDIFGEMAILTAKPRVSDVVCRTEVEVLVVTEAVLTEGLGLGTWVGRFATTLAERFREADAELRRRPS